MKALTIERKSPAICSGVVKESVGIETIGGVFAPLIRAGTAVPATDEEIFSTAEDYQESLIIDVSRGDEELASRNHQIGRFKIVGISPAPKGLAQIRISFVATQRDLILQAVDLATKKHLRIVKLPATLFREEIAPVQGDDSSLLTMLQAFSTNSGVALQLYEKLYGATFFVPMQQGNLLKYVSKGVSSLLVFTQAVFVFKDIPEDAVIVELDGPTLWSKLLDATRTEQCEVEVDPLQPHSIRLRRSMILGMVLKLGPVQGSDQ
jgi:hypothetical protein